MAGAMILVSLWALLLPPLFPYSAHAIVNTHVVTIRAGSEGLVSGLPGLRERVIKAGEPVARVTRDQAKVRRELAQKELRREKLRLQLDNLDATIKDRAEKLSAVERDVQASREAALRGLAQAQKIAEQKARIGRDDLAEKRARQAKVEPLFKEGIVTSSQWSETRQQTLEAERTLAQAEAELGGFAERLAQAARGVAPGSEAVDLMAARVLSYEREIGELRIQRSDLAAEIGEVERQIALEQSYGDADRAYTLTTPIDGVVWRRQVVDGEPLSEGQAVVDMADVKAVFVEAYFSRDFINDIAIGDQASVYLISASRYVRGRVVDVQMQERSKGGTNVINAMALDNTMLRVQIEVAPGVLDVDSIGKLAKVQVSKASSGWVGRGLMELGFILRGRH